MNEIQKTTEIPSYILATYDETGGNRNDLGQLRPADFGISFCKLVMEKMRETKVGWGPTGKEAPLPLNTMFLSRDHHIILPGTRFIPLMRRVSYIKWIGKPGEGRMEFQTDDANDPRILACDGLAFRKNERTGVTDAPIVTEYTNFYIWLQTFPDEPVLLSYHRTSVKNGRKLTQDVTRATKMGKAPLCSLVYQFEAPRMKMEGTQEWPQFAVSPSGFTPEAALEAAMKMREIAEELSKASELTFAQIERDSVEPMPQTITAQATPLPNSMSEMLSPPPQEPTRQFVQGGSQPQQFVQQPQTYVPPVQVQHNPAAPPAAPRTQSLF